MWTNAYSLEQFGEFVREARRSRGYTQVEFAKMVGTSHATLSNLENGKPVSSALLMRSLLVLGSRIVVAPKSATVKVVEDAAAQGA